MKKAGAVVLIATMWLGMMGEASAHHRRSVRRVNQRVTALNQRVTFLEDRIASLEREVGCFGNALPVSQFFGYVYRDDAGAEFRVTALDVPTENEAPGAWLSVVDSTCVSSGRFAPRRVSRQMR